MSWMRKLRELNSLSPAILGIAPNRILVEGKDTQVWDVVEIGVDYEEAVVARGFSPEQAIDLAFIAINED